MRFSFSLLVALSPLAQAVTLTTSTASYTVSADSANSLVVVFSRTNCDITSLKYRGTEIQTQSGARSHIASGFSSPTVSATTVNTGGVNHVKITCAQSGLTHYYVIRDGDSSLHMATYVTTPLPVGEHRWIGRFLTSVLSIDDVNQASSVVGADSNAVEGSDVYTVNGQTRSKFYSSQRFIDDKVHCLSGTDIKACMVIPGVAYETSSGGPFFRDMINADGYSNTNPGNDYSTLYWYMHSGHVQTEDFRPGLKGPYAVVFSRSGAPSGNLDLSFMSGLDLSGYVATSGRGYVSGTASGVPSSFQIVLHWYNSAAQYWVYASSNGAYTSPAMKPGTYTMVLYQGELKVATSSVTVSAGATVSKSIASTWTTPANTIFQIGDWDGQPFGFRNADKFLRMHPSDSRMSSWGPLTYTVGSSAVSDFPMAIFRDQNAPVTIKFNVPSSQAGSATLIVGTTLSFDGARPGVTVNGVGLTTPAAPVKIDSRGVTRGAYRGYGDIYTWTVNNLVAGSNTITITAVSGSAGSGGFLSANFIVDAVHLHSPNGSGSSPTTTTRTTTAGGVATTTSRAATTTSRAVTTSASGGGGGTVPAWGQCGGSGWTGGTVCDSGSTCTFSNEWYSQCIPA